jgi:hypothetical protein
MSYLVGYATGGYGATSSGENYTRTPSDTLGLTDSHAATAPSTTKMFSWTSDDEGMVDLGLSAITAAREAADGDPAGCVKFTTTAVLSGAQEQFARNVSGQTWETWGVPAGATVTAIQLIGWKYRLASNTGLTSHSIRFQVIGPGADSVTSAVNNSIFDTSLSTTQNGTWQTGTPGSSIAVNSEDQASTTDVRMYIWLHSVTTTGTVNYDFRVDELALQITSSSGTAHTQTINDALGSTDSMSGVQAAVRSQADALGLTDSHSQSSSPNIEYTVVIYRIGSLVTT